MRTARMLLLLAGGALAAATSAVADPVTLSGTVVDESGAPIADAEVFAVSFDYDKREASLVGAARTDADGRFAIPGVDYTPGAPRSPLNVAALAEGRALGWTTVQQSTSELRVVCAEPVPITGRVTDQAGQGVAVRLTVSSVYPGGAGWPRIEVLYVPAELAGRLSVDSDAQGRFAFPWAGPGVRVSASVAAPGLGTVEVTMNADLPAAEFTLLPAATLRGRVVCADAPEAVAGLDVRVRGYDRERSISWSGEAQTDAEGRFEIADLYPGPTSVSIRFDAEAQWQAPGQAVELAPGQTAEVEIALARAYLLTGRVVDEVTGAPIEGVRVYASPTPAGGLNSLSPTDAEGRYRLRVLPGRTVVYPGGGQGYVSPEYGQKNVEALVIDQDIELADISLKPGVTVRGRVVDAAGEPVADAEVSHTAQTFSFHRPLRTDERGEFAIQAVDPDKSFTVRARKGEAMTASAVSVDPRAGEELLLVIREGAGVRLAVRVVDGDGAPMAGADVKGYWRTEMFGTYPTLGTTDADGRLVSEPQWPDGTYSVTATAPGCDQAQSEDWTAVSGETHDFGELTLVRAAGVVAGRVVDGAGQAVAGATVYNSGDGPARVEAQTDAEGRFRLEGLYPGGACVIAQTDDLFGGALIQVGSEDAVITITPEPEVTLGEPVAIAPLTDEAADRAAALALIEAMLARPPEELGRYRGSFVGELAKLDADRAWALSDEEGGEYEDAIIRALGEGLLREDPDQALAWLEGTENPTSRGFALMNAVRKLAAIDPDRARAELDALIPTAPEMGEPKYQAAFLAHCGETLYGLDPEAAKPVIRQAEEIAQTLPLSDWDAYARGLVAEALCHFDLDGALALIANLTGDYEPTRHQPNIAARIAASNPAKAAELLGMIDDYQRGWVTARVAYAMAPTHPDEALALARQANQVYPHQEARALGYVALALRPSDPGRAGEVFSEAVALLAKQSTGFSFDDQYLPRAMAELAHIGAQIGYPAVERLVWRAIALRPAPSQEPWDASGKSVAYLGIVAFVAPELTRELIRAEVARNPMAERERHSRMVNDVIVVDCVLNAATACDAKLALELALSLPHDTPADEYPRYASHCLRVVRLLLMPREQRFISIATYYSGEWVPGADDD